MIDFRIVDKLTKFSVKHRITIEEFKHAYRLNNHVDFYKKGDYVRNHTTGEGFWFESTEAAMEKSMNIALISKSNKIWRPRKQTTKLKQVERAMSKDPIFGAKYIWNKNQEYTDKDLYFVADDYNCIKIGRSKNVTKRLKSKTFASSKLTLIHVEKGKGHMESELHRIFDEYRKKGEWFVYDYDIELFIDFLRGE